jgi:hypothetical protein
MGAWMFTKFTLRMYKDKKSFYLCFSTRKVNMVNSAGSSA